MQNVEKTQLVRSNELEPVRIQTLIIGRGAVGSMFQRELSGSQQKSETPATKEQQADVQIISHREITPATLASAELIILATPNHSVEEMITEILERAEGELPPILLIQNGVGVVEKAHAAQLAIEATGRPHQELHLIRASVFTQVSQTDDELAYNDKKLRIALANAGCTQLQLSMVKTLLEQAGFQVLTGEKQKNGAEDAFDYKELEEMKLLANMIGASSTVTGMSPKETFADPDLFDIELEAFSDRLDLLRVKNKNLLDIGWIKTSFFPMFKAVSKLGRHSGIVRSLFALVIAKQRNNQPSAAWSRVEVNGDITEAIHYFSAGTVFWNGPMGVYEEPAFATGTQEIARAVAKSSAQTIIGGGDTIGAITQFGMQNRYDYISAAGGAALEFLAGEMLPGIEPLIKTPTKTRKATS